jgi:hypothetical protein
VGSANRALATVKGGANRLALIAAVIGVAMAAAYSL